MIVRMIVVAALTLGGIAGAPAAEAQRYGYGYPDVRYEQPYRDDYRPSGYRQGGYAWDGRRYDQRGDTYFEGPRRCSNGTTGAILGALAGGLLGHTVAGRGDRTLGTVLGAGAGALAGHAVERSNNPGYCR